MLCLTICFIISYTGRDGSINLVRYCFVGAGLKYIENGSYIDQSFERMPYEVNTEESNEATKLSQFDCILCLGSCVICGISFMFFN